MRLLQKLEGHFDGLQGNVLRGWVSSSGSDEPVEIAAAIDGIEFYTGVANIFRDDLCAAGKARGGSCAYEIIIQSSMISSDVRVDVFIPTKIPIWLGTQITPHGNPFTYQLWAPLFVNWLLQKKVPISKLTPPKSLTSLPLYGDQISVAEILRIVLHREPDHSEVESASQKIASGVRLSSVARDMLDELDVTKPQTPALGREVQIEHSTDGNISSQLPMSFYLPEDIVQSVYRAFLTREAEPAGLEIYSNALRSGMTVAALIEEFSLMPGARKSSASSAEVIAIYEMLVTLVCARLEKAGCRIKMGAPSSNSITPSMRIIASNILFSIDHLPGL